MGALALWTHSANGCPYIDHAFKACMLQSFVPFCWGGGGLTKCDIAKSCGKTKQHFYHVLLLRCPSVGNMIRFKLFCCLDIIIVFLQVNYDQARDFDSSATDSCCLKSAHSTLLATGFTVLTSSYFCIDFAMGRLINLVNTGPIAGDTLSELILICLSIGQKKSPGFALTSNRKTGVFTLNRSCDQFAVFPIHLVYLLVCTV